MGRRIGGRIDQHEDQQRLYRAFGKWVRVQREAAGLEQQEVAELIGCARSSITNIEAGHQRVSLHLAVEIMGLFGAKVGGRVERQH